MHSQARAAVAVLAVPSAALLAGPVGAVGTEPEYPVPSVVSPEYVVPTVVRTERVYPPRTLLLRTSFHVPAAPSPGYVFNVIVPHEARRWGAPVGRLACRVRGESGGDYNVTNGQYLGIGQFARSTFDRGVSSMGVRRVRIVERRERPKKIQLVDYYSDGSSRKRWGWAIKQKVIHVYRGRIPRNPGRAHAWAQVRIMAQAMVGRSAVSDGEWEVRC